MTSVMVIHKVEDYNKWKKVFDQDGAIRKVKGSKGASIFHNSNDPKQIIVITEWENLDKATNFAEAEDLKIVMKKAGVIGRPEIFYLEELDKLQF
jgi:heme-degrading monooxygenase HmoA